MAEPSRNVANTPKSSNSEDLFLDVSSHDVANWVSSTNLPQPPSYPPPAYNFHIRDPEAGLPPRCQSQHNYPLNEPITPLKTRATHNIYARASKTTAQYQAQGKYQLRRFICICMAILLLFILPLVIVGSVFHWGQGNSFCVQWSDGTESGDCSSKR